jgi:hypothetical protein
MRLTTYLCYSEGATQNSNTTVVNAVLNDNAEALKMASGKDSALESFFLHYRLNMVRLKVLSPNGREGINGLKNGRSTNRSSPMSSLYDVVCECGHTNTQN